MMSMIIHKPHKNFWATDQKWHTNTSITYDIVLKLLEIKVVSTPV